MKTETLKRKKKAIGEDFKLLLTTSFINDISESHLEAWKERYSNYGGNIRRMKEDLYINHDDSLEIEAAEEELKRELTTDETDLLSEKFHKKVIDLWKNGN